jgi:hypothetical protein
MLKNSMSAKMKCAVGWMDTTSLALVHFIGEHIKINY